MRPSGTQAQAESAAEVLVDPIDDEAPWHRFVRKRLAEGEVLVDADDADQLEISIQAPSRSQLSGIGRFENNLARKGFFDLRTNREEESTGSQHKTDLVGKTTLSFTMGALGPLEMDCIAWTMGRWQQGTEAVTFGLRELCRSLGVSWKGQKGNAIKDAFMRIKATTITGRVWDAAERKHTTIVFSIFDRVEIVEERASEHGPATRAAGIKVVLSEWVLSQLRAGQYSDFEWRDYRGKLTAAFSRRLYLLLESQEGTDGGTMWRVVIDDVLGQTLGTLDATRNASRFRANLRASGAEICAALSQYKSITVVAGQKRGEYWLEVRRSVGWREQRLARRRRTLPAA
jgi:hypothetical protein